MKRLVSTIILSLLLITLPLQLGLTETSNQDLTELSSVIMQLNSMPEQEKVELKEMLMNYLQREEVNLDLTKEVLEWGGYRFAEAVEFELQARLNGLDEKLRQQIRTRLNVQNNQQLYGLTAECLRNGVSGEKLALELENRKLESTETLQQALQTMLHTQLHHRLQAHNEYGVCPCEECMQLREQLRDGSCCDCEECLQLRERLQEMNCQECEYQKNEDECGCGGCQKQEASKKGK